MLSQRTSSSPRSSSACRPQLVFLLAVAAAFLRSVHTQCGESRPQELRAAQVPRFFTSPDFGRSSTYPKNATCEWVIRASANNRQIQLEVVSSDLEAPLFSECDDVVSVRDGANNETSRSLSEWCGERRQSSTPLVLISSSDSLSVNFRSDDFFELRGFNITYQEFQVPGCPPYWTELDDSCYRPFLGNNQHLPWVEAQTECTFAYANLMTVSSEEEYEFLTGLSVSTDD